MNCTAELRPATPEEIMAGSPSRGWFTAIDRIINSICTPLLLTFGKLYDFILRRSPDLVFAPIHKFNVYTTKNRNVIKEVLDHHRNDPQQGVFSHTIVIAAITQVMKSINPKIGVNDVILTCDPEHTATYRPFLNSFFSSNSIKQYHGDINSIITRFSKDWGNHSSPILLNKEIKLMATAIMAEIFLGHPGPHDKISTASSGVIRWTTDNLFLSISKPYRYLLHYFPNKANISSSAKEETAKILNEAVEKSLKAALQPDSKPSLVKEMVNKQFSNKQIQAMIITLFVAGQDNVSTSLSHALLKLAQSPELQEKIKNETHEPWKSTHIRALLCESLRVLCPVSGIGRTVAKPSMLTLTKPENGQVMSKTLLQAGDEIQSMISLTAKDPSIYPDPENFDYTRNLNQKFFIPGLPYLPFGDGTHLCPGWLLYYTISALTIANLVHNYHLSTTFKGEPKTKAGFVTTLDDRFPIPLKLDRRSSN